MKTVEVKLTTIELRKLTGNNTDEGKFADTCDLITTTLDIIPQGGFTPKDIRDRNRIQFVIDEYRKDKKKPEIKDIHKLKFEDADYDNLKSIVNNSRWVSRDKALQEFIDSFNIKE